jgi:predicted enzyme related to lactoylglutathione lyase
MRKNPIGSVTWRDLTVANADAIRDFYASVAGWKPEPVGMGDYDDYNMTEPESGTPAAGICHARGMNTGLPTQWLMYINVADVEASARKCKELGGTMVTEIRNIESMGKFCVIKDPAGAVVGLFEEV